MKGQKFPFLFLLLALPFLVNAQDAERSLSPEQALDVQKAALSNFEYFLFRFESAQEESDLKSMEASRKELVKMMQNEIERAQKNENQTGGISVPEGWLKKAEDGDLATGPEDVKKALAGFKEWWEKEVANMEPKAARDIKE